ncbi:hypothetical protein GPEL0_01f5318 [Geoanaerobacter pelophilus]|uniref:Uncharacterized protein n=1 Tax=Geoanaerobacter pelophilus TaxID=60036 RepID=A0ABQ0MP12_9BACT|nr:hypothetical protein GPEL0_01f5318 [Geoanaerobacter pelophilus]
MLLQKPGELEVVHLEVELEVEPQAPRVEVCAADQAPAPVHHHELGVDEGWGLREDAHTLLQQLPKVGAAGPLHVREVVDLGKDQGDGHPPERRGDQRRDQRPVGDEVGGYDGDPSPGAGKSPQDDPVELSEFLVRPVAHRTDQRAPCRHQLGVVARPGELCTAGEAPILQKGPLQVGHHRSGHLEVQVLHHGGAAGDEVPAADVHPAGEGDLPVHHQQLAVVPEVQVSPRPKRQEAAEPDPRTLEQFPRRRFRILLPQAVHDDPHLDPPIGSPGERHHEALAGIVPVEDVGAKVYRAFRPVDGGQHGGVGFLAVFQRRQVVAGEKPGADHVLGEVAQLLQVGKLWGKRRRRLGAWRERLDRCPGLFVPAPGPAVDAVDPHAPVEERAQKRDGQAGEDPPESRARVALVDQRVPCGDHGKKDQKK